MPSAHGVHAALPTVLAYVPTVHSLHSEAPMLEVVPAGHDSHAEACDALLNFPD